MADFKSRVCEIVTNLYDQNGKPYLTTERLQRWLDTSTTVVNWAWVVHDKDTYREKDEKANPAHVAGKPKAAHIDCAVEFRNPRWFSVVARELGINQQCIMRCSGKHNPSGTGDDVTRQQFMSIATYLSHKSNTQRKAGKYPYPASEIHTSGWDYEKETDAYLAQFSASKSAGGSSGVSAGVSAGGRGGVGGGITPASELPKSINYLSARAERVFARRVTDAIRAGEITPQEVKERYTYSFYEAHQKSFDNARHAYIRSDDFKMPHRVNMYIGPSKELVDSGLEAGGIGKTSLARKIAKALYPNQDTADTYIEITDPKVAFDDYEEQPILLWDESRAGGMIGILGRTKTFAILETNPGKTSVNIKYSRRTLVNSTNIVNGITPVLEYLDGLAGEYTDKHGFKNDAEAKSQVYRRFPIVIEMTSDYVTVWVNKFTYDMNRDPNSALEFRQIAKVHVDFGNLMRTYDGAALAKQLGELLDTITNAVQAFLKRVGDKVEDVESVLVEDQPVVEVYTPGTGMVMDPDHPYGYYPDKEGKALPEPDRVTSGLDAERERYRKAIEDARNSAGYLSAVSLYESDRALFDALVGRYEALESLSKSNFAMTDALRNELDSLRVKVGSKGSRGTYSNAPKEPNPRDFLPAEFRNYNPNGLLA